MMTQATNGGPRLELLASTGNTAGTSRHERSPGRHLGSSVEPFLENAQWTADGTVVLTSSSDNQIAGYIVPEDLLAPNKAPLNLGASCRIQLPERSNVLASAPYFDLAEPYTHQVLVSTRDHPIQLYYLRPNVVPVRDADETAQLPTPTSNAAGHNGNTRSEPGSGSSHQDYVFPASSSFPFIKPGSETFETATALIWPGSGQHFIAGTRNMLAKFDVSRTGSGPLMHIKTVPSNDRKSAQAGRIEAGGISSLRGIISTLSAQPSQGHAQEGTGLVAAGTWTRWVGLYDFASSGRCVATWGVTSAAAQTAGPSMSRSENDSIESTEASRPNGAGGAGITQTIWSPCGRYLLVNERRSRGMLVYDIRVTGKLLGWLSGRDAVGNQRILCDTYPGQESTGGGFEVWSGTTQGTVKVWEGVGSQDGEHVPSWDWQAHDGAAIGSACLHQSGSVVATASGSWDFSQPESSSPVRSASRSSSLSSSSRSSSSASDQDRWLCRKVKESSLKLWGIASSSTDHDGMDD